MKKENVKGKNAPVCDFIDRYNESKKIRLHMPGHKGKGSVEAYDITEIYGADSLYEASGIIRESELIASEIFGARTFYSAEGSSLSIRAMLYIVNNYALNRGNKPFVLASRNAHKTFVSAAALVGIDVEWIYPSEYDGYLTVSLDPKDLAKKLDGMDMLPTAVYVTSPDYLGHTLDIKGIGEVCHERGVLLLVDNAHGAYLKFLTPSRHPIDLGADMCCDSAHKTLKALTGAGYLHVSYTLEDEIAALVKPAMALFGSTSPSYLILASLDRLNGYLSCGYRADLQRFVESLDDLKRRLISHGYNLYGDEPLKITILAKDYGYLGTDLGRALSDRGIEYEFADPDYLTLMLTPDISDSELKSLYSVLISVERRDKICSGITELSIPVRAFSMRDAMLKPSELVRVDNALGRVLSELSVGCPPAVPILVYGEVIDSSAILRFKYYGIDEVRVIKG